MSKPNLQQVQSLIRTLNELNSDVENCLALIKAEVEELEISDCFPETTQWIKENIL